MSKREIIQAPTKFSIINICIVVILFIVSIIIENKKAENNVVATSATEIPFVEIIYGPSRGSICFSKNNFISSSAKLIDIDALNYDFWGRVPIMSLNTEPYQYRLDNLNVPYYLFKEKDNDTINVIKNGIKIRFVMNNYREE